MQQNIPLRVQTPCPHLSEAYHKGLGIVKRFFTANREK